MNLKEIYDELKMLLLREHLYEFALANWLIRVGGKGNSDALRDLGSGYENGYYGFETNSEEAMKWYIKAVKAGNSFGQYRYAVHLYLNQSKYRAAFHWFTKADVFTSRISAKPPTGTASESQGDTPPANDASVNLKRDGTPPTALRCSPNPSASRLFYHLADYQIIITRFKFKQLALGSNLFRQMHYPFMKI